MKRIVPTSPTHSRRPSIAFLLLVLGFPCASQSADKIEFNRDIRPILSENCYACHGPDKSKRKADLRLDDRASSLAHQAIVAGKPTDSELVARILSNDPDEQMPPPESTKTLSPAQKALLQRWITEGAEYQPHWAYIAPKRPAPPAVKQKPWVRNSIDAFILAGLEAKTVQPSREADKRTLVRRLSLDLTGLPPSPEDVERFLRDESPQAYESLVDRLLASPHYGERMAVPWLDLARLADTVGFHGDQNLNCFPYRDYVIDAFNKNKPFDVFTAEQLAGDLLPNPSPEQLVATGFNRLNMVTREGGAQTKEYLAKYAADRVRTVANTWLGSTMGCCECHDHKYDPFTAKDFYRLATFFSGIKQWGVYADYGYTPTPELKGFTNDYPFPPEIEVESPYLIRRQEQLRRRIRNAVAESASRRTHDPEAHRAFNTWQRDTREFLAKHPDGWSIPAVSSLETPAAKSAAASPVVVRPNGSVLIAGRNIKGEVHRFRVHPSDGWLAAIRVELLPDPARGGKVTRNRDDNVQVDLSATLRKAGTSAADRLEFAHADAEHKSPRYAGGLPLIGIAGAWKTAADRVFDTQTAVWVLARPIRVTERDVLTILLRSDNAGCVRFALSPIARDAPASPAVDTALVDDLRDGTSSVAVDRLYLLSTGWDQAALSQVHNLEKELLECRGGRAFSVVTQACEPLPMRVLPRGNWMDETGALLTPGSPGFLPQLPDPADGKRLTRLDLARWITFADNPLTARVYVNRLWKTLFGTGLSAVVDDVGAQGEWPTHPELLDWLAVEFRDSGWNVKHMVKLLVMSAAYRQDARLRPELADRDPNNRWLASQSPRRLEAEFVRDNALTIAGLINLDLGGPSVRPYQPPGYYVNIQFPNRDYIPQLDDRQYRRGLYMHWQRTFLHPMLANFDAPSREDCIAARNVANTPQQALTLLNDPTFVESARVLATRLLSDPGTDAERIDRLFERALARPPKPAEARSLTAFLAQQRSEFQARGEDAAKLLHVGTAPLPPDIRAVEAAAWTSVCRVVLNLHETITRY